MMKFFRRIQLLIEFARNRKRFKRGKFTKGRGEDFHHE